MSKLLEQLKRSNSKQCTSLRGTETRDSCTGWRWELYYRSGEGREASEEHMEPYKLLEAPRKTVKIIISIAETAHLSLQPSGRQTSRGQCCAQQNIHNTRGKAKRAGLLRAATLWTNTPRIAAAAYPGSCQPLSSGTSVCSVPSVGMVAPSYQCLFSHVWSLVLYPGRNASANSFLRHISWRTVMPRHCFLHPTQIPALLKAPCETSGVTWPLHVFAWHL